MSPLREEFDAWALARLVVDAGRLDFADDVYEDYRAWMVTRRLRPMTRPSFGQRMRVAGFKSEIGTRGSRFWRGLMLRALPADEVLAEAAQ